MMGVAKRMKKWVYHDMRDEKLVVGVLVFINMGIIIVQDAK